MLLFHFILGHRWINTYSTKNCNRILYTNTCDHFSSDMSDMCDRTLNGSYFDSVISYDSLIRAHTVNILHSVTDSVSIFSDEFQDISKYKQF